MGRGNDLGCQQSVEQAGRKSFPLAATAQTKSTAAGCGLATTASGARFDDIECLPTHSGVKTFAFLVVTALAQPRDDFVWIVTAGFDRC
jgi:hypothetical protein